MLGETYIYRKSFLDEQKKQRGILSLPICDALETPDDAGTLRLMVRIIVTESRLWTHLTTPAADPDIRQFKVIIKSVYEILEEHIAKQYDAKRAQDVPRPPLRFLLSGSNQPPALRLRLGDRLGIGVIIVVLEAASEIVEVLGLGLGILAIAASPNATWRISIDSLPPPTHYETISRPHRIPTHTRQRLNKLSVEPPSAFSSPGMATASPPKSPSKAMPSALGARD